MTVPDIPAELVATEPAIANELDEAIFAATLETDATPVAVKQWAVRSLDEAEWAMRKLAALKAREKEIGDQAAAWHARIGEWEIGERNRVDPGVRFFAGRLEDFALRRRAMDERNKTTRLPSGRIETRGSTEPKVVIVDEDAALKWAKAQIATDRDLIIKTVESVRLSQLRDMVEVATFNDDDGLGDQYRVVHRETSEVVDGVSIEWPETIATVKVD